MQLFAVAVRGHDIADIEVGIITVGNDDFRIHRVALCVQGVDAEHIVVTGSLAFESDRAPGQIQGWCVVARLDHDGQGRVGSLDRHAVVVNLVVEDELERVVVHTKVLVGGQVKGVGAVSVEGQPRGGSILQHEGQLMGRVVEVHVVEGD